MQLEHGDCGHFTAAFQYRKRYGLHAMGNDQNGDQRSFRFQYRKRYGLHAMDAGGIPAGRLQVSIPQAVWIACNSKDLFQAFLKTGVSIPQAVWIACNDEMILNHIQGLLFQYRKRYGLHAMRSMWLTQSTSRRFNTASGMDCMQCFSNRNSKILRLVSIPQAVWIACNC